MGKSKDQQPFKLWQVQRSYWLPFRAKPADRGRGSVKFYSQFEQLDEGRLQDWK